MNDKNLKSNDEKPYKIRYQKGRHKTPELHLHTSLIASSWLLELVPNICLSLYHDMTAVLREPLLMKNLDKFLTCFHLVLIIILMSQI